MTVSNNKTPQKEGSISIKVIKLLGVFLCCAVIGVFLFEIVIISGLSIKSIKLFRTNFTKFSVTICPPIWYLWFVDKKLGSKIQSSSSFCAISFLIAGLLVVLRLINSFFFEDERLCFLPEGLTNFLRLPKEDLFTKSTEALEHLNSLSDLLWQGVFPFIIIAGIGEELIFRGILQNIFLEKTKKPWMAIVSASILFTLAHGTICHSIKIFLMGLLLGTICHITSNIYVTIFTHMLNNGILVLFMYFFKSSLFLDSAIRELSIWQITLVITICMCCIFILLKKLIAVQRNIHTPPTWENKIIC